MAYGGTTEAWIVSAIRTPVGKHSGVLSTVRPDDLGATALKALMDNTDIPSEEVEDVYFGCANQAGEDNRNVARMSLLLAGFPETVAGATVNRLCGSGLEAVSKRGEGDHARRSGCVYRRRRGIYEPGPVRDAQTNPGLPHRPHNHVRHNSGLAFRKSKNG